MQIKKEIKITKEYLRDNANCVFVFGDNLGRVGYGGAAALRDEPNVYGFITKKDLREAEANYTPKEYLNIFTRESIRLGELIKNNPEKMFLVSKLGAGLANKYHIWEEVVEPSLPGLLEGFENVILLWK